MGCSIHTRAERRDPNGTWVQISDLRPFEWRSYGMYGWLAGVRNHSAIPPIAAGRGLPPDVSNEILLDYCEFWEDLAHSMTWVSVAELLAFDYDAVCEDRRARLVVDGNVWVAPVTIEPGQGQVQTYRELLGEDYFQTLGELKTAGAERVVLWFDS